MRVESEFAWESFRESVRAEGGTVIETEWLGSEVPHRVVCSEGHQCSPRPHSIQKGQDICYKCGVSIKGELAWECFCAAIERLGGTVMETQWLGSGSPHHVTCLNGHECHPRPDNVRDGTGICKLCNKLILWDEFCNGVETQGGTILELEYLGSSAPHRATCINGHECMPQPRNVKAGYGICRICGFKYRDNLRGELAWEEFKDAVNTMSGTVVERRWLGFQIPHRVICSEGHECSPRPNSIRSGHGVCRICAGSNPDTFYMVANDSVVKIGIASNGGTARLRQHSYTGLTEVLRLWTNLDSPKSLESSTLEYLRALEHTPIRGREYFRRELIPTILNYIES
jgi:hypothetical protein